MKTEIKISFLILFVISVLIVQNSFSQSLFFLTLRPGIKSNAMGGAQTAIVNDYQSFYYNPAGLSRIKKGLLGFSNMKYSFITFRYLLSFSGGAIRTKYGTMGFSTYFFSNQMFPVKQRSYQFSYASKISTNFHIGISVKYLYQNYYSDKSSVFAGDLGVLLTNILPGSTIKMPLKSIIRNVNKFRKNDFTGFTIGFSLLNTGYGKVEYPAASPEPIPQMLNLGLGYKIIESDWVSTTLAMDLNKILVKIENGKADNFIKAWFTSWQENGFDELHSGVDLNFFHLASIYFGYEKLYSIDSDNNDEFTFGFGIGPDFARLEAFYGGYPLYLHDEDREKTWRFGFNLNY